MKILVFDIGGTAIKYGICQDGHLEKTKECPTEAFKGGPHILNTVCSPCGTISSFRCDWHQYRRTGKS